MLEPDNNWTMARVYPLSAPTDNKGAVPKAKGKPKAPLTGGRWVTIIGRKVYLKGGKVLVGSPEVKAALEGGSKEVATKGKAGGGGKGEGTKPEPGKPTPKTQAAPAKPKSQKSEAPTETKTRPKSTKTTPPKEKKPDPPAEPKAKVKAVQDAPKKSFSSAEEAEDHFYAKHGTNLKKGKMSDAEFVKTARVVSDEYDRLEGGFKAAAAAMKRRKSIKQSLELGTDFTTETGSARGSLAAYRFGEGIRVSKMPLSDHAEPRFGGHTVASGSDFRATLRHEFGHEVYETALTSGHRKDWGKVATPYVGTNKVSSYGGTNASELFAESFSAYTSPKYKRGSLPGDLEKWLDKYVK